ncbi:MAG TPA: DUF4190 domain-containing protein [Tepidisphaeraceae bacterium]|jgi:hypothetical protein
MSEPATETPETPAETAPSGIALREIAIPEVATPDIAPPNIALPEIAQPGGWSVSSLAGVSCGILLVVPFIAGIAAIVLGVMGLRETREPLMRGRRLAIAAIVLGLVNIVGWTAYAEFISGISSPGRGVAHRFVTDLNTSKLADAAHECVDGINTAKLQAAADELKQWGGAKSVAILNIESDTVNGTTTGSVRGSIHTPSGEHSFQLRTVGQDGVWKVSEFSMR